MRDWAEAGAAALGRGIGAGAIDPRALAEFFLDAIANHRDAERIYARVTPARARAEAAGAADRARRGVRRGPLDGVPASLKDLFDTAGTETEAGSRLLAGRVPDRDAACVTALGHAGMVTLGKTHLSELAFSGLGVNPMTATPPNRHGEGLAPGGSSSGAAASVAFGLAPVALGSDTGGSVRGPAAWNDLVGLKTTAGLIPLDGCVPLSPTFDTVGPLCRSVEDAALMLGALTGRPAPDLTAASLRGVALLVPETLVFDAIEPEPLAAFEAAVERLARAGARIDRAPVPELAETLALAAQTGGVVASEGWALWGAAIEADPEAMFAPIRQRFRSGAAFRADQSEAARQGFARLSRALIARIAPWDAMIAPTMPILPPPVDRLLAEPAFYAERNLMALRNNRVGNMLGLCGLSLPTGAPACGLLLYGRPFEEARLLRLGAAAEGALAAR
jgi:aspartyl-tRNA(Asn)/glutamyl-tRNA(Gln) amidotransferase subunit A